MIKQKCPTSSPGPSPRSKWWSEKPLAKAAEILQESWSILSRDTWRNGFFGGCFQRLAALFVFCNRKPLFKRNEVNSSRLHDEILTNFWSHFSSLGQGFLRPPFWTRRRPWGRGCKNAIHFEAIFRRKRYSANTGSQSSSYDCNLIRFYEINSVSLSTSYVLAI